MFPNPPTQNSQFLSKSLSVLWGRWLQLSIVAISSMSGVFVIAKLVFSMLSVVLLPLRALWSQLSPVWSNLPILQLILRTWVTYFMFQLFYKWWNVWILFSIRLILLCIILLFHSYLYCRSQFLSVIVLGLGFDCLWCDPFQSDRSYMIRNLFAQWCLLLHAHWWGSWPSQVNYFYTISS